MNGVTIPSIIDQTKVLQFYGWKVDSLEPYQISHLDGSVATLTAAKIVEYSLTTEYIKSLDNLKNFILPCGQEGI